jgi:aspartate racemase
MKTIGILGGMSPESTATYYTTLNRLARAQFGGYASAKITLHSVNFANTHAAQIAGDWDGIGAQLGEAAAGLERAGADMILLATNTMHKCAPAIQSAISIPFVHIGEACAAALTADNRKRPVLLGTRFTMLEDFYTARLIAHNLTPIIPDATAQDVIHDIIFNELVHGIVTDTCRQTYIDIIQDLKTQGADSVILGCTEIGMLLNSHNSPLIPYDTLKIHCAAAMQIAS